MAEKHELWTLQDGHFLGPILYPPPLPSCVINQDTVGLMEPTGKRLMNILLFSLSQDLELTDWLDKLVVSARLTVYVL